MYFISRYPRTTSSPVVNLRMTLNGLLCAQRTYSPTQRNS